MLCEPAVLCLALLAVMHFACSQGHCDTIPCHHLDDSADEALGISAPVDHKALVVICCTGQSIQILFMYTRLTHGICQLFLHSHFSLPDTHSNGLATFSIPSNPGSWSTVWDIHWPGGTSVFSFHYHECSDEASCQLLSAIYCVNPPLQSAMCLSLKNHTT